MKKFFRKLVVGTLIFVMCSTPLFASAISGQWGIGAINASNLQGSVASELQNITIAVIDTGLDVSHPAFSGKIVSPHNFTSDGSVNDVTDIDGHGTHIAGIIAANSGEVQGVARGARIMPLKVISPKGSTIANLAKAITYAADNGAGVINISLEMDKSAITSELTNAVNYAESKGCVLVASVGNDSSATISAPACMDGVIAVGSAGFDNVFYAARTSNRDDSKQILYAPGIDILSTYSKDAPIKSGEIIGSNGEKYLSLSGSSMAAAFVSGAAALYKASGKTDVNAALFASAKVQPAYIQGCNGPIALSGEMRVLCCGDEPTILPAPIAESITTSSTSDNGLADIKGHWAEIAIDDLSSKGIVMGTSSDTFSPEDNITRVDYMLMVVRMFGINVDFSGNFADVAPNTYYYNAIGEARQLGLIQGDDYNLFEPNAPISRQDMFVIMYKILQMEERIARRKEGVLDGYDDCVYISNYAKEAMESLADSGIIMGVDNMIYPLNNATRAETSMFLYRVMNN